MDSPASALQKPFDCQLTFSPLLLQIIRVVTYFSQVHKLTTVYSEIKSAMFILDHTTGLQ